MKKYTLSEAALAVCWLKSIPFLRDYDGAERAKMRDVLTKFYEVYGLIERAVVDKKLTASYYGYAGYGTKSLQEYQAAMQKVGDGIAEQKIVDIPRSELIAFMKVVNPDWKIPVTLGGELSESAGRGAPSAGNLEHTNTQLALGVAALLLAEKVARFKVAERPNAVQIASAIETMAGDIGLKGRGFGASALRAKIKEAVELVTKALMVKKKSS